MSSKKLNRYWLVKNIDNACPSFHSQWRSNLRTLVLGKRPFIISRSLRYWNIPGKFI